MRNAAVVDSGPLLALFDRDDAHHARVRLALKRNAGLRLITTWPVLTETSALLASRVSKTTEIEFLDWVAAGAITVEALDNADLDAMTGLLRKYRDLPFDFADTSVAALAEAHGIDCILSVDRDFEVYRAASGKPLRNLVTLPPARRSKPRSVR